MGTWGEMDMSKLPKFGSESRSKSGSLFGIGNLNKKQMARVPEDEKPFAQADYKRGRKQRLSQEAQARNARIKANAEALRSSASGIPSKILSARNVHEARQIARYAQKESVYNAKAGMQKAKANLAVQQQRTRQAGFNVSKALGLGSGRKSSKIRYTGK
jgi:hypothetical protein